MIPHSILEVSVNSAPEGMSDEAAPKEPLLKLFDKTMSLWIDLSQKLSSFATGTQTQVTTTSSTKSAPKNREATKTTSTTQETGIEAFKKTATRVYGGIEYLTTTKIAKKSFEVAAATASKITGAYLDLYEACAVGFVGKIQENYFPSKPEDPLADRAPSVPLITQLTSSLSSKFSRVKNQAIQYAPSLPKISSKPSNSQDLPKAHFFKPSKSDVSHLTESTQHPKDSPSPKSSLFDDESSSPGAASAPKPISSPGATRPKQQVNKPKVFDTPLLTPDSIENARKGMLQEKASKPFDPADPKKPYIELNEQPGVRFSNPPSPQSKSKPVLAPQKPAAPIPKPVIDHRRLRSLNKKDQPSLFGDRPEPITKKRFNLFGIEDISIQPPKEGPLSESPGSRPHTTISVPANSSYENQKNLLIDKKRTKANQLGQTAKTALASQSAPTTHSGPISKSKEAPDNGSDADEESVDELP